MSKKPMKKGDIKQLEMKMARKKRPVETQSPLPPRTIIFCEGTKTEPHYLRAIVNIIEERCRSYAAQNSIKLRVRTIEIDGVGRSNRNLFEYAKENLTDDVKEAWLVYDKDDFPLEYFNETPIMVEAHSKKSGANFHAIWSNECFELWFLLHFIYLDTPIIRNEYVEKLKEPGRLPGYEKSNANIYDLLKTRTKTAVKNAKMLEDKIKQDEKNCGRKFTPSEMVPCTKVYELVEYLMNYI